MISRQARNTQAHGAAFPGHKRIFPFELDGKTVLGFDTGLNERSFAQAKMTRLLNKAGFIVHPDGKIESWQPGGVLEHSGQEAAPGAMKTMVIWGPSFFGEELGSLIGDQNRKDEALDALRFWLGARIALNKNPDGFREPILREGKIPGPTGIFIVTRQQDRSGPSQDLGLSANYPIGTVFFPPELLLQRALEAEEPVNSENWTHPDLTGSREISFCAGVMLYNIFCDIHPFQGNVPETIKLDMRESNFIPPELAAPGLDPELAALISAALGREDKKKSGPEPEDIAAFLKPPFSKPVSLWQKDLSSEELSGIRSAEEQYRKKTALKFKARRFATRNTAIIVISVIVLAGLLLFIRGIDKRRSEMPSTIGMRPFEVVKAYYSSFGALDHIMMEACVSGRTGKQDIDMVISLYVITKARKAYELSQENYMPALEWVQAGRPDTNKIIFGITDLDIKILSENGEKTSFEAAYVLWMPGEDSIFWQSRKDNLELTYRKGSWRITEIVRSPQSGQ